MAGVTVTRIVHSCVLLDFAGTKILTDPWFSQRFGYYWGETLGIQLADLPHLDAVIVSHDHYDHYDLEAFKAYKDKDVLVIVKRGMAVRAWDAGFHNVVELDPWGTTKVGSLRVTATPAKHSVPENTYMLESNAATVFFGADTLLIPGLAQIASRFPRIDLALLPVNGLALRPLLNRQVVMTDRQAAELCAILRPRVAVPIHYSFKGGAVMDTLLLKYKGTAAGFARAARQWAPKTEIRVLAPGVPSFIEAAPLGSA